MKKSVSPVSVEAVPVSPDSGPTTPKSIRTNAMPFDSRDREKKRKGARSFAMEHKQIDDFRMKILEVYRKHFRSLCRADLLPDLTYDFIFDADGNFADNVSKYLTDEKFDPADLSIVLLAIDKSMPLFVNNKAMKGQVINGSVLRHVISKDVVIVDFSDLTIEHLTKADDLEEFCLNKFGKDKGWVFKTDGKIGVADTGFISRLAKLDKLPNFFKGAFIVPEFVKRELERETSKPVAPYRAPVNAEVDAQIKKQLEVANFLSGSNYVDNFLSVFAHPNPNLEVSKSFDIQKSQVKGREKEGVITRLLKLSSAYASISGSKALPIAEQDLLYAVYSLIHGANISRDNFDYILFLKNITTLGVENISKDADASAAKDNSNSAAANKETIMLKSIDELFDKMKNKDLSELDAALKSLIHTKSAESYNANTVIKQMSVLFNSAFGPLYSIYRSIKSGKINTSISNTLCLEFNKYLLKSLDENEFECLHANKNSVNRLHTILTALSQDLFTGVFNEISDFIESERNMKSETSQKPGKDKNVNLDPPSLSPKAVLIGFDDDNAVSADSLLSAPARRSSRSNLSSPPRRAPLSNLDFNTQDSNASSGVVRNISFSPYL